MICLYLVSGQIAMFCLHINSLIIIILLQNIFKFVYNDKHSRFRHKDQIS